MIDNFDQIKDLLKFESEDDFYFCQILKRKKEHKELGSNSYVVKTYFISSFEAFDNYKPEMINLAEFHNARVYINLNRRSFERTGFHTLKKIVDQILNKDYKSIRKAYSSVCGMYSADEDKTWVVDIDAPKKSRQTNEVLLFIDSLQPVGNKLIAIIDTKNGFHLITKPFNIQEFNKHYSFDVHKNNPTILYIP